MATKKVLFCSALAEDYTGGISKWTKGILSFYCSHACEVKLIHYTSPKREAFANTSTLKRIIWGLKGYIPLLRGLRKHLSSRNYDVLHISSSASYALIKDYLAIKIAHYYGTKVAIHFHFGRIPQIYQGNNWERKLIDKVIREADCVITMDKASCDCLVANGFNHIELLPNPLSTEVMMLADKYKTSKRNDREIVFVGHVVRTKGIHELIAAAKKIDNAKLLIYGTIPAGNPEIEAIRNENCKNITFYGETDHESIIAAMSKAAVFVLPSYSEGFPNVILESMACGCPIVATSVGAIPDMLDADGDKCGFIVNVKDVDSLRDGIEFLLNHPEEAHKLGEKARKRVNDLYAIDSVWKQLELIWLRT